MQNNETFVSVVVPIYNVEKYLKNCIETIINQTYKNIEIILVDDGSTDNCPKICDEYRKKDSRIKVIHKKNGGLSDARNQGLKLSRGEYICFIDSDDFIDKRFIEILYKECCLNNAEIAMCKYEKVLENEEVVEDKGKSYKKETISGRDSIIGIYEGKIVDFGFVAWNKLYKRKLFENNNIDYPFGKYNEDTFTTFRLLYNSKKVVKIDLSLYYYRIRIGSIMKSKMTTKKITDHVDADIYNIEYYKEKKDEYLLKLSLNYFFRDIILLLKKIDKKDKKNIEKYYIKYWENYSKKIKFKKYKKIIYLYFFYKFKFLNRNLEK